MSLKVNVFVVSGLMLISHVCEAKTVRARDLTAAQWSDVASGKANDLNVEFRQGDELPVSLVAQGDLIETTHPEVSYVRVKRNFWIQADQTHLKISWDGITYTDANKALNGSLTVGAGSAGEGGIANALNIVFQAEVKK